MIELPPNLRQQAPTGPKVSESDLLMATAEMHSEGWFDQLAMGPPLEKGNPRPGRVQGEGGGGGRIDFQSAGAKRGEFKPVQESAKPQLTDEDLAKQKADMKAAWDKLMEKYEKKQQKKPAEPLDPSAGRIGFGSLGTKR